MGCHVRAFVAREKRKQGHTERASLNRTCAGRGGMGRIRIRWCYGRQETTIDDSEARSRRGFVPRGGGFGGAMLATYQLWIVVAAS
jgi:hypothetical protein